MKIKLLVIFLILTSLVGAEVIFHDDFNRSNGELGNSWNNTGVGVDSAIESGVMKITSSRNSGVYRSFDNITSGIYYVQYDWKFSESQYLVSSYPTDFPVQLLWDHSGSIYTDPYEDDTYNPTLVGQVLVNNWVTVKWKIDLDNDTYSLWLGDEQIVEDATANVINTFNKFNFRSNGIFTSGTQYVDNFVLFDENETIPPSGLLANGNAEEITLTWNAVAEQDLVSYRIYRSTSSPAIDFLTELTGDNSSYIDNSVVSNTDYFYRVTSVLVNTLESPFSEEVNSHLIPLPLLFPESYELNIGVANPIETIDFNLSNSGAYPVDFTFTGTDDFVPDNQLMEIPGFTAMGTYEGHTYYKSNTTMPWNDAKTLCEEKGGHLVTISDFAENTFVYEHTTPTSWLGLTDEANEGDWQWITGEAADFLYWLPGEPNNDGDEDYAQMGHASPYDKWNDNPNDSINNSHAILEFDYLFPPSILRFDHYFGTIEAGNSNDYVISIDASTLADGIYETSIKLAVAGIEEAFYYPVILNVDFHEPAQVTGLFYDQDNTDANQIGISWDANAVSDQVTAYQVYRKGRDETDWRLMANLPDTQLSYIDTDFTPIDSTNVYYSVEAIDWVGNVSPLSDAVIASLERYLAPEALEINEIDKRDIKLSWNPVTQTITGLEGTPSCYIIYKSQTASPLSEYDFLAVSFTNEYIHEWALFFQPSDKLFYIVTAYGGDMTILNRALTRKDTWKKGELEKILYK